MHGAADRAGGAQRGFLGHPPGLAILFFAEMWERFSYYGMRALLIFYLIQHWRFDDAGASLIYGAYGALVYITPVIGGYLADRWLGQRKAVLFGAAQLACGHLLMAVEGGGGEAREGIALFWLALAFIIAGSGFLKANISVLVGQLYSRTDIRRDAAYTIFYVGVNLGAFLGSLAAGWLGQTYGWRYGFGAAGLGMLLGLAVFALGTPLLGGRGEPRDPALLARRIAGVRFETLLYAAALAGVALIWWLIQHQALIGVLLGLAGGALVLHVLVTAVFRLPAEDRDRILAALVLIVGSILFWALFEQAGSSLNLYTDRYTDRRLLGFDVPASVFQAVNPFYIMLLGPVFAAAWTMLARRGAEPSAPAKFGLGLAQLGLSFLVLTWGARAAGIGEATPVIFIFLIYLLQTTGELCLSPVGLSAMNRLAPPQMAGLMMGAWFFATSAGNFAAGMIAAATGSAEAGGAAAGKATVLAVYDRIGWIAIAAGAIMLLLSPLVRRLMHLGSLRDDGPRIAGEDEAAGAIAGGIVPGAR